MDRNDKIGAFDIETYLNCENKFVPFAAAFKVKNDLQVYYWDKDKYKSPEELVLEMLEDMLVKYSGATFYAHNLGSFDGVYVINAIALMDYKVNIIAKGINDYVKIVITKKVGKKVTALLY